MTRVGPVSVSLEVSVMLACLNTIEFRVNEVPKGPPKPDGG